MIVRVESPSYVSERQGKAVKRSYYSFWLRLTSGPLSIALAGWKFYPDTKSISSPSQYKGDGRFFNLTKPNKNLFNEVAAQAAAYFNQQTLTVPTEEGEEVTA